MSETSENQEKNAQQEEYRYYAFISYKREDERWARWLQDRIETYRLPSVIRKSRSDLPQGKIRPKCFLDTSDLSGDGDVASVIGSLKKELRASRYLIIICSPKSAKSGWVRDEIETFRELGRWNRIIPFIVDGEPNANASEKECFSEALRSPVREAKEKELLGISVKQDGKTKAFVRVVARMLGLPFDDLWDRHRRRSRQNSMMVCLVAMLFLSIFCFAGYSYWDYHREKTTFFADYVDEFGIPKGIFPLTAKEIAGRNSHYRFVSSQNKLRPGYSCQFCRSSDSHYAYGISGSTDNSGVFLQ